MKISRILFFLMVTLNLALCLGYSHLGSSKNRIIFILLFLFYRVNERVKVKCTRGESKSITNVQKICQVTTTLKIKTKKKKKT